MKMAWKERIASIRKQLVGRIGPLFIILLYFLSWSILVMMFWQGPAAGPGPVVTAILWVFLLIAVLIVSGKLFFDDKDNGENGETDSRELGWRMFLVSTFYLFSGFVFAKAFVHRPDDSYINASRNLDWVESWVALFFLVGIFHVFMIYARYRELTESLREAVPDDIKQIMSIRGTEDRAAAETRYRYYKSRADKALGSLGWWITGTALWATILMLGISRAGEEEQALQYYHVKDSVIENEHMPSGCAKIVARLYRQMETDEAWDEIEQSE
jgi:hypothetical protein